MTSQASNTTESPATPLWHALVSPRLYSCLLKESRFKFTLRQLLYAAFLVPFGIYVGYLLFYRPVAVTRTLVLSSQLDYASTHPDSRQVVRIYRFRRNTVRQEYYDYPPYGSLDKVQDSRRNSAAVFYTGRLKHVHYHKSQQTTPEMEADFAAILRFVEKVHDGGPDHIFARADEPGTYAEFELPNEFVLPSDKIEG